MAQQFKNSAEVRKFIVSRIVPTLQQARALQNEVLKSGELSKFEIALKAKQVEIADLHARVVTQQIKKCETSIALFEVANVRVQEVMDADGIDIGAEAKLLEPQLAQIASGRSLLTQYIKIGGDALDRYKTLQRDAGNSESAAIAIWSRWMAHVRSLMPQADERIGEARQLMSRVDAAAKRGDAAQVTKVQDEAREALKRKVEKPDVYMNNGIARFEKLHDPRWFGTAFTNQYLRDIKECNTIASQLPPRHTIAEKQLQLVIDYEMPAADPAKVIKVLGLKTGPSAMLKRALDAENEAWLGKELESMAKQSGMNLSGKAMVAKLRASKAIAWR